MNSDQLNAIIDSLSWDERLAQLIHPAISPCVPESEDHGGLLEDPAPGGCFLFQGTAEQMREMTSRLQRGRRVPLVISSDLENGPGRMIQDATKFPDMLALAAADDDGIAREMARSAAIEGRAAGIHWALGPMVDINANPHNPICNTRGLGDDPDRIARLSRILIETMQENGLAACAKHFPGDGYDDRDQHISTTINPLSREDWKRLSGRMFQEAIAAGVWTIMPGHIALPSIDPGDPDDPLGPPPATLSPKLLQDLLRGEMGFDGLVLTDAMGMGGITSGAALEDAIIGAISCGCDMLLFCPMHDTLLALRQGLKDGRLTEERVLDAVRRVLTLKDRLGLFNADSDQTIEAEPFRAAAADLAARAATLLKGKDLLPLPLGQDNSVLVCHVRGLPDFGIDALDEVLTARGCRITRWTESDPGGLPPDLDGFDSVIVAFRFDPAWGTQRIRPSGAYLRTLQELIASRHPHLAAVSFGSPYHLHDLPGFPVFLNSYSADEASIRTAVRILAGEAEAVGQSPVRCPPFTKCAGDHLPRQ